jgi:hypothetical protein
MLLMATRATPELRDAYLMLAKEKLRGADQAAISATLEQLNELSHVLRLRIRGTAFGWPPSSLLPLLPELLQLAEAGNPDSRSAALELIGSMGPSALDAAPRLLRLAEQDSPAAAAAVQALAHIIPDDPAFQQSLLTWSQRPAMRERAALVFLRVAGTKRPKEAVALLLPLAQVDNVYAIDGLADLGPAAASSTPVLLARLEHASNSYTRDRALRALIRVAPDEAAVVDTLVGTMLGSPRPNLHSSDYLGLKRFSLNAAALVPAIDHLIDKVRWAGEKEDLRTLILTMALPGTQKKDLLAKLDQQSVQR